MNVRALWATLGLAACSVYEPSMSGAGAAGVNASGGAGSGAVGAASSGEQSSGGSGGSASGSASTTAGTGGGGTSAVSDGGVDAASDAGASTSGAPITPTCAFSPNDGAEVGFVTGVTPAPSSQWDFELGAAQVVPNGADVPIYKWFPDGHISVLPDGAGQFLMFWAEVESYRTLGSGARPETHTLRNPEQQLFHGREETSDYDNGGIWLHSVFRKTGTSLLGFFAAEDQYCCPRDPQQVAWRSMGVTSSSDNGATWSGRAQILTAAEARPALSEPHQWGGDGDGSAIWDQAHCRWMLFYQHEYVTAAVSTDPEGRPGTWFKYFEATPGSDGDFTEPGLGGRDSPLQGLDAVHGGNPSVHFNSYLGKWVMVYHGWDPQVSYVTSSVDLLHWDAPRFLVDTANPPGRGWYPTIIGDSDLRAGQQAHLYYTDMDRFDGRYFMHRDIRFTRRD